MCVCPCLCVCVFLHNNSRRNQSRNTKLDHIEGYKNSSDEFDIELSSDQGQDHCRRSKIFPIYHNTNCQVL